MSRPRTKDPTGPDHPASDAGAAAQPGRRPTPFRALAALLALVVFGATAFGWAGKSWLGAGIPRVAALDRDSDLIVDAAAQQGAANVLIVATGSGPGQGAPTASTVALAHVPAGGGPLVVLAFPPDLAVDRPACARWAPQSRSYTEETVPAAASAPLASAFELGGPRCATRAVQRLSGIAVTGFVGLDLDRIEPVAQAVDGVRVCVPRPVTDGALGTVVAQAGRSTLDGPQAAALAAAAAVTGDPATGRARIERQQLVLAGALTAAIGGAGLLDAAQLSRLRPALGQALTTDNVDLDQLLELSRWLQNLQADGVRFAAVPTETDPAGAVALRDVDAAALFAAVRADQPLPTGAGADADAPEPGQLRVAVLNGTERTGLAATVAGSLGTLGYGVGDVGTAEQVTQQTLIRFSPDQAAAASLLAGSVPAATPVPDPGTSGVLQLVLGTSYDDVLRPPAGPVGTRPAAAEAPRAGDCG